jgi:hypothetical protein
LQVVVIQQHDLDGRIRGQWALQQRRDGGFRFSIFVGSAVPLCTLARSEMHSVREFLKRRTWIDMRTTSDAYDHWQKKKFPRPHC